MELYVPTAPEMAPNDTFLRASLSLSRSRLSSHAQLPNFMPNVMGSAWMPWVRPTQSVFLSSNARRRQISPSLRQSSIRMSVASHSW